MLPQGAAVTMVTPEEIEQLEAFDAQGAQVLSLYLEIDPASQVRRAYRRDFDNLVKEAREHLAGGVNSGYHAPDEA